MSPTLQTDHAVKPPKKRHPFNLRMDDEDWSLISALVSHLRLGKSTIMRIAIRRMAEDELLGRKRG